MGWAKRVPCASGMFEVSGAADAAPRRPRAACARGRPLSNVADRCWVRDDRPVHATARRHGQTSALAAAPDLRRRALRVDAYAARAGTVSVAGACGFDSARRVAGRRLPRSHPLRSASSAARQANAASPSSRGAGSRPARSPNSCVWQARGGRSGAASSKVGPRTERTGGIGLSHYEVRSFGQRPARRTWVGWHRHIVLAVLALPVPPPARGLAGSVHPASLAAVLLPLTVPEVQRPLWHPAWTHPPRPVAVLRWSDWCGRHRQLARRRRWRRRTPARRTHVRPHVARR